MKYSKTILKGTSNNNYMEDFILGALGNLRVKQIQRIDISDIENKYAIKYSIIDLCNMAMLADFYNKSFEYIYESMYNHTFDMAYINKMSQVIMKEPVVKDPDLSLIRLSENYYDDPSRFNLDKTLLSSFTYKKHKPDFVSLFYIKRIEDSMDREIYLPFYIFARYPFKVNELLNSNVLIYEDKEPVDAI